MARLHGRVRRPMVPGLFVPGEKVRIGNPPPRWQHWNAHMDCTVGCVGVVAGPPTPFGNIPVSGLPSSPEDVLYSGHRHWVYSPETLEIVHPSEAGP